MGQSTVWRLYAHVDCCRVGVDAISVYLRLLDVPVPAISGRSADENPFA
jgi:hypothetical protein